MAFQPAALREYVARQLSVAADRLVDLRVRRRSIDARQRQVFVNLTVEAYVDEPAPKADIAPIPYPDVTGRPQVVVVGAGPGGLFAALRLVELGLRPIVLERGKDVRQRKFDVAQIARRQCVDPESNYCFGEGGAGAYSDGKLFTRSKKRGSVEKVLRVFCQHGAPADILVDAHPHIGTDKLPRVVERMREQIRQAGGEVHFQTRVEALLLRRGSVVGVRTAGGAEYEGPVILATGHSARDVYRYLHAAGFRLEAKGIAVGVRLEHPAYLVDEVQYHSPEGRGKYLPAAEYAFVRQCGGRGVFSFCMCPGGIVVPAATGSEQIVVNGMSPSSRSTAWSNAGMVVETRPEDLDGELRPFMAEAAPDSDFANPANPLRLMLFQEALERVCWEHGQRQQTAPAQRMADFVAARPSQDLPKSSYAPGLVPSPLHTWLPRFVARRLQEGFRAFDAARRGFLTNEAAVIGVETRTSSPVRIPRDATTLQHVSVPGLFPCGEGAGYAGGIVSAAIDGERCAEAAAAFLQDPPTPII